MTLDGELCNSFLLAHFAHSGVQGQSWESMAQCHLQAHQVDHPKAILQGFRTESSADSSTDKLTSMVSPQSPQSFAAELDSSISALKKTSYREGLWSHQLSWGSIIPMWGSRCDPFNRLGESCMLIRKVQDLSCKSYVFTRFSKNAKHTNKFCQFFPKYRIPCRKTRQHVKQTEFPYPSSSPSPSAKKQSNQIANTENRCRENQEIKNNLNLVVGFNPSEKYYSVGIVMLCIWKNRKCSKPPTSNRLKSKGTAEMVKSDHPFDG